METEILSHYTQFPVLLDILNRQKLVLGNPSAWDDKTDFCILKEYANSRDVRVLCLTKHPDIAKDNILHWKIYAPGKSGCRIDFDKKLLENAAKEQSATLKKIEYLSSMGLEEQPAKWKGKLPFLKRSPYTFENEWRIIWIGNLKKDCDFELDISKLISKGIIKSIKLSPELPKNLAKNMCSFLKGAYKKYGINYAQSWLYRNPDWERTVKKLFISTIGDKK